jgi:hypothetical protein
MANKITPRQKKETLKERKALLRERALWAGAFVLVLIGIIYMGNQF